MRVVGQGWIEPTTRQVVRAPDDGRVESVFAHAGELVAMGQPLFRLVLAGEGKGGQSVLVRAPTRGRVQADEPGAVIDVVGREVVADGPVLTLVDPEAWQVRFFTPPGVLHRLEPGHAITVRVEGRGGGAREEIPGRVIGIATTTAERADGREGFESLGSLEARGTEVFDMLREGLSAEVAITVDEPDVLALLRRSIGGDGNDEE